MQSTLKQRLESLDKLVEAHTEASHAGFDLEHVGISVNDRTLTYLRKRAMAEFFRDYPLAEDVASGRRTFDEMLMPIKEFYKRWYASPSLWPKIPKADEEYTRAIRDITTTIDSVGIAKELGSSSYALENLLETRKWLTAIPSALGGAGVLMSVVSFFGMLYEKQGYGLLSIAISGAAACTVVSLLAISVSHNIFQRNILTALSYAGQETERYLQKVYNNRDFGKPQV